MTHVATLIVNPATPVLGPEHVAAAARVLPQAAAPRWLGAGIAADLPFAPGADAGNGAWADRVRAALAGLPVDVVVQAAAGRRKRLLVADMDSTLIGQECIDELAAVLGLRDPIAAITARSMRGEIAFEPALRERVGLLAGLPVEALHGVYRDRIRPNPGAGVVAPTMRAHGGTTAIVSGGFTLFTVRVAHDLGFDSHHANRLVIAEGRLTGLLEEPILGAEAKRAILRNLRDAHGLARGGTMAVGDGANDLAMLAEAGLGVAYHGKPAVAVAADARIDHGDLTALLYIQGIPQADFATV